MAGKISELKSASQVSLTDLVEVSVLENNEYKSKKHQMSSIVNAILNSFVFSSLKTNAKTIINAINEAFENGGGTEIDDDNISTETTWSSYQISNFVKKNGSGIISNSITSNRNVNVPVSILIQDVEE